MRQDAQAVVIGGGVIGCSILYHLTKLGWHDVVLLERNELTSGSTWHAAANIHGLHDSTMISRLQHYTMRLYKELETETGQGCGVFQPGALYLAQTEARETQLRLQAAKARLYQMNFHELSRAEAEALHPLVDFEGIRCIMFEPDGGNVDPSGVTAAYAAGAKARGAEIHRFCPVTATLPQADGRWIVETERGAIVTDWVINAAGLWGREVAALAGVTLPLQPTEHQYFVTETLAEIATLDRRLPSVADRDGEYYLRQEGQGLLVGAYEQDVRFWAESGTPLDFAHGLFADDLDRIEANMMRAIKRVPALGRAGIKRVINGPMIWSPDGNVLMGPVPEKRGYFCCNGIIPGFSQSGGLGLMAAQWIIEGEAAHDVMAWDMARFDDWADAAFTRARVKDQYAHRFAIHFPGEDRAAGRPCRTRPAYDQQAAMGAKFGLNAGWEHPLYFADDTPDSAGFTRQPWSQAAGREARMLRSRVGVIDISNFAKYQVTGPGAAEWLRAILAGPVPMQSGAITRAPMIGARGGIAGDFTVTCVSPTRYWLVGSGMAERGHRRYWTRVPLPRATEFRSQTAPFCGFNIAGPLSRDVLSGLSDAAFDTQSFTFHTAQEIRLSGIDCLALRLSFTGDLGWELYCAQEDQARLYAVLIDAAQKRGGGPVGSRALTSLRLEKGYGAWGPDYNLDTPPQEVGMAGLCRSEGDFLNKHALVRSAAAPARENLVLMEVDHDATARSNADAAGGEPVFYKGRGVGRVTSGGYGYVVEKSLALVSLQPEFTKATDRFDVMILGVPHAARILHNPPFDPQGTRLRA